MDDLMLWLGLFLVAAMLIIPWPLATYMWMRWIRRRSGIIPIGKACMVGILAPVMMFLLEHIMMALCRAGHCWSFCGLLLGLYLGIPILGILLMVIWFLAGNYGKETPSGKDVGDRV
jgi:hypothetical protein